MPNGADIQSSLCSSGVVLMSGRGNGFALASYLFEPAGRFVFGAVPVSAFALQGPACSYLEAGFNGIIGVPHKAWRLRQAKYSSLCLSPSGGTRPRLAWKSLGSP